MSFVQSFIPNQNLMTLAEDGTSVSMALLAELNDPITAQPVSFASVSNPQNSILTAEDAMNAVFSSSVTYEEVLPDTDLEYTVDAGSVKEYIVVNEPQTSYAYHFALTLSGLTAQMEEDGSVGLYTAEGEKKYTIPAPYMFDAAGDFSHAVAYTLQGESGKYFLTVTADAQWLNDPSRVWPVKIDPTIVTIYATADTYVDEEFATWNFGTESHLKIGASQMALIKTDNISLPAYTQLNYASLRVYYYYPTSNAGTDTISANRITSSWSPTTVTWNNSVFISSNALDTQEFNRSNSSLTMVDFNVTNAVVAWLGGAENYGVVLKQSSAGDTYGFVCASEYPVSGYRPKILYEYQPYYTYTNYCNSTFSAVHRNRLPDVIDAVSTAYTNQFGIAFSMNGSVQARNDLVDSCSSLNSAGNHTYCGDFCEFPHHKDIIHIDNELRQEISVENERVVYWSNPINAIFCTSENSPCKFLSTNVLGLVHNNGPIIQMLRTEVCNESSSSEYTAAMAINLIHETAHTFGHDDVKDDVLHRNGGWNCVMEYFQMENNDFLDFFDDICAGRVSAFCNACEEKMITFIANDIANIRS